ncbi:MAG: DUF6076 domain-containing protein, partial [Oscillospiraceae bacterium]
SSSLDDYRDDRNLFRNIDSITKDSELTMSQKYDEICKEFYNIKDSIISKKFYRFTSFIDCFNFILFTMIEHNCTIKKCPNCGNYFVPTTRSDTIYCSNTSPQDNSKTCGDYMKYQNYLNKTRNDEATKLYKQLYNSKRNKTKNCENPKYQEELTSFIADATQWKSDVKMGTKTEQEYIEWLKSIKEKKV